ncbi:unnamed protein product [Staurois parvus]|uniref:Uncharacterized protein n=1 Tax=Staurois parvus TaxID=386267 RepID=A0ABN9HN99_9NEOB|nr:unnamed protein product [Staurois parvus]
MRSTAFLMRFTVSQYSFVQEKCSMFYFFSATGTHWNCKH